MERDPFDMLKDLCIEACHERKACAEGYKQMVKSGNISQIMATWRANWEDVVDSKYADIIRIQLPKIYPIIKADMNAAGIYLNECPRSAQEFVLVIVTDTNNVVKVFGYSNVYILGECKVSAYDHSQVYNSKHNAQVTLYDYSYGKIFAGEVVALGHSNLSCMCEAIVDGTVKCMAYGGTVVARKYRKIEAYIDAVVYSQSNFNITLCNDAKIVNLKEYEQQTDYTCQQ